MAVMAVKVHKLAESTSSSAERSKVAAERIPSVWVCTLSMGRAVTWSIQSAFTDPGWVKMTPFLQLCRWLTITKRCQMNHSTRYMIAF